MFVSCASKKSIDFTNYENFVNTFYMQNDNTDFDKIKKHFYDDGSCVRVDIIHHDKNMKKDSEQMMVFEEFEEHEIEKLNSFLNSMGDIKEKVLVHESVENILDIPVGNLYQLNYEIKYANCETKELFFLKQKDNRICVYQYSIYVNVFE